jgi:hypothetical protein
MKQNKAQFILDYYVEVGGIKELSLLTAGLNCSSVMYAVEPWPSDIYRVYVKKDVKHILEQNAETAARCK